MASYSSRMLMLLAAFNTKTHILLPKLNIRRNYSIKASNPNVSHLAKTARISLTPQQVQEFGPEIQKVVDWFGQLQAVDLKSIEPAIRSDIDGDNLRGDVPIKFENTEAIIAGIPSYDEPYIKVLHVGEELFKETLPLHMGSRYYNLQGLKPHTWYEVKISYPASIPAAFSLELKKNNSDVGIRRLRKLLNTEKLIFKTETLEEIIHQGGLRVLITVEPEGVVAIRGVRERETILFNIAWLVVAFALICIVVGFLVPLFIPAFLLPRDEDLKHATEVADKDS